MGSDAAKARLAKRAAYPQQMNDWIAEAIVTECLGPSPPSGGGAMTSVPCTRGYVRDILDSKHLDPKVDQYSGRGDQSKGLSPSPLANPWKIGVHGDRDEVVETFTDFAHNNALIRLGARALGADGSGATAARTGGATETYWRSCTPERPRSGPRSGVPRARGALQQGAGLRPGRRPHAGRGSPLTVVKKGTDVHIVDGAGVCSPGNRRAKDRRDVAPEFSRAAGGLPQGGVHRWCAALGSDPRQVLFALAAGRHADKDVPTPLAEELSSELRALVGVGQRRPHSEESQTAGPGRGPWR